MADTADALGLRPVHEDDLAMLARYLFAHTTVHRIEASTEMGNLAEQRALEKAGFTREGVRRGTGWRDGAWRDGVTYSLLRTDQPERR